MLQADKDALLAVLKKRALDLRRSELQQYLQRFDNLAAGSTITAAFGISGLQELATDNDNLKDTEGIKRAPGEFDFAANGFVIFCSIAIVTSFYTLVIATMMSFFGKRLALQGTSNTMPKAIAIMVKQQPEMMLINSVATISIALATSCLALLQFREVRYPCLAILGCLPFMIVYFYFDQLRHFFIPHGQLETGRLQLEVEDMSGGAAHVNMDHAHGPGMTADPNPLYAVAPRGTPRVAGTPRGSDPNDAEPALREIPNEVYRT